MAFLFAREDFEPTEWEVSHPEGLISHWSFDGPVTGLVAADLGVAGQDGTLPTIAIWDTANPVVGSAAACFNGINHCVDMLGSEATYNFVQQTLVFSMALWVLSSDLTDRGYLISTVSAAPARQSWGISWEPASDSFRFIILGLVGPSGSTAPINVSTPPGLLVVNTWTHLAITWEGPGNTGQWYVNGSPVQMAITVGNPPLQSWSSIEHLVIGCTPTRRPNNFYLGCIDDVRIYDRALAPEDVQALYQLGASIPDPPTGAGVAAWYKRRRR